MFGYVKILAPELRMREYEAYRAVYCGLCRAMKTETGSLSRLFLSYDFVFLALARSICAGERLSCEGFRCPLRPTKKRAFAKLSPSLSYSARAAAVLTEAKLLDDIADEKGIKRLRARVCLPFAAHAAKKAALPELREKVSGYMKSLSQTERENNGSLDSAADAFGELLGDIFAYGAADGDRDDLYALGHAAGRFIYAADAADDAPDDAAHGRYNAVISLYGRLPDENEKKDMFDALTASLIPLGEAAERITGRGGCATETEILRNIVYLGISAEARRAIFSPGVKPGERKHPHK